MEVGLVRQIDIDAEMQQSYLDYAMSVIIARALPDARDGLKPVHRRILHAMYAMGIRPDAPFKKSARIVGEVLGKFHPHSDVAVYDSMVRMSQPFSMRYPLIDGQGNFGSVDGDPPAAMRYTEARLTPLAMTMMADIDKDTVAFVDNFDGSLREPTVLPSAIPNLLVNGATGIAVGMSTAIPPHNLGEVCDALVYMLENWTRADQISIDELMNFIPGPDFPTGGILIRQDEAKDDLAKAYGSGRGKITLQARAHIEAMGRGRSRIIINELPYQVNKSNLIERIADLARSGKIEGISDLRDESDREGMRIVIELAKNADPKQLLASLYHRTPMQTTVSVIMLALVDGEPRMLSLKQALRVFLEHRLEVVERRTTFDLSRAREREHILLGLRIALKNLDEVIQLIRAAKDAEQANLRLQKRFKLSEAQARAILDMPLRRLANLERKKIENEYKAILARIKELESLLRSKKKMRTVLASELAEIKAAFGNRRRTLIAKPSRGKGEAVLTASDLMPDKETWVVVSASGLIFRTPSARLPRLSGRDTPMLVIAARTQDMLYLFDAAGRGAALPVHTIVETDDPAKGRKVAGASALDGSAPVIAGVALSPDLLGGETQSFCLFMTTRRGMVKKTPLNALPGASARPFTAIKLNPNDELGWVDVTAGGEDVLLFSNAGMAIRFSEEEVRPMGLSAAGVMGMRLAKGETLIGMGVPRPDDWVVILTEEGQGKRVAPEQFSRQGRNGKGVRAWKSGLTVDVIGASVQNPADRAVLLLARGPARSIRLSEAPKRARASAGKALFELAEDRRVIEYRPVYPRPNLEPRGEGPGTKPRASSPKRKPAKAKRRATAGRKPKKEGRPASRNPKRGGKRSKPAS